jgi:hypothetical protein
LLLVAEIALLLVLTRIGVALVGGGGLLLLGFGLWLVHLEHVGYGAGCRRDDRAVRNRARARRGGWPTAEAGTPARDQAGRRRLARERRTAGAPR